MTCQIKLFGFGFFSRTTRQTHKSKTVYPISLEQGHTFKSNDVHIVLFNAKKNEKYIFKFKICDTVI